MSASPEERGLIREATIDVAIERGFEGTTVELICERAGVEPDVFGRHFVDVEDAYLRIFEENSRRFEDRVRHAFAGEETWRDGLRAAAYATARYFDEHPRETRFGAAEMLRAGAMAQVVRERQLQGMIGLIDAGRGELEDSDSVSRRVAEAILGAIYTKVITGLNDGELGSPAELVPQLMYLAVGPYLGQETAREELRRGPADLARYERGEI